MTPLTAPLPLRTTAAWDAYREAVVIPHRYGNTGGVLLQYDQQRRVFVWADHPVVSIDAVLVNGQQVGGWAWRNRVDSAGRAVAFVEFDEPVDEGAQPVARGRGKRDASTGVLLTQPADVIYDVLATIAGQPVTRGQLAAFRAACDSYQLEVGGSIESAATVRAVVQGIVASIGAIYAPDARDVCHLYPGGPAEPARWTAPLSVAVSAAAGASELVTDLTLRYAHESGQPRAAVQLDAPDAAAAYGARAVTIDAPWVTSARVAVQVATRLIQHAARPLWRVNVGGLRGNVRIGDTLAVNSAVLPLAVSAPVLSRELDAAAELSAVAVEWPVGDVPAVRLIRQASQLEPEQYTSVGIVTIGDQRVLTLREEDGRPIVGASVTLNGGLTRQTDGAGRVSFPASSMPPGQHTLSVVTLDGRTLATVVIV